MSLDLVIYPSHPPKNANDVILAPETGPPTGGSQDLAMVSSGGAAVSATVTLDPAAIRTSFGGNGGMTAAPGVTYGSIRTTMAGQSGRTPFGAFTMFWYLSSPVRFTPTFAGVGHMTANESGQQPLTATMAGVGHMTNYLSSPVRLTPTMAGVGGGSATLSYAGRLQTTFPGATSMTASLIRGIAIPVTANGVGTMTVSLTRELSATIHGVGGLTAVESGNRVLASTSAGVGHLTPTINLNSLDFDAVGIGQMTAGTRVDYMLDNSNPSLPFGNHSTLRGVGSMTLDFSPLVIAPHGVAGGTWRVNMHYWSLRSVTQNIAAVYWTAPDITSAPLAGNQLLNFIIAVPAFGQMWPRAFLLNSGGTGQFV